MKKQLIQDRAIELRSFRGGNWFNPLEHEGVNIPANNFRLGTKWKYKSPFFSLRVVRNKK